MANNFTMRVYKRDLHGKITHSKDMPDIPETIFWYAKELAIGNVTHNMIYLSELTSADELPNIVRVKAPIEYWYEIICSYSAYVKQLRDAKYVPAKVHIIKKNNGIYANEEQAKAVLERLNQPKRYKVQRSPF